MSRVKLRAGAIVENQETQEDYRKEIERMIKTSTDSEYLCGVYSFARHYPDKSVKK